MIEKDRDRILNFLLGNEKAPNFEAWIYHDKSLESRLDNDLYFELIYADYQDNSVKESLSKLIIGDYITEAEFEHFKLIDQLKKSGWYENRKVEIALPEVSVTNEIKNAQNILSEFGGLKLISSENWTDNWTLTLLEFVESISVIESMEMYGVNKKMVLFACAHNRHINLYVDNENKFFYLDNVVSENLYVHKGQNIHDLIRDLLQQEYEEPNFIKIRKSNE